MKLYYPYNKWKILKAGIIYIKNLLLKYWLYIKLILDVEQFFKENSSQSEDIKDNKLTENIHYTLKNSNFIENIHYILKNSNLTKNMYPFFKYNYNYNFNVHSDYIAGILWEYNPNNIKHLLNISIAKTPILEQYVLTIVKVIEKWHYLFIRYELYLDLLKIEYYRNVNTQDLFFKDYQCDAKELNFKEYKGRTLNYKLEYLNKIIIFLLELYEEDYSSLPQKYPDTLIYRTYINLLVNDRFKIPNKRFLNSLTTIEFKELIYLIEKYLGKIKIANNRYRLSKLIICYLYPSFINAELSYSKMTMIYEFLIKYYPDVKPRANDIPHLASYGRYHQLNCIMQENLSSFYNYLIKTNQIKEFKKWILHFCIYINKTKNGSKKWKSFNVMNNIYHSAKISFKISINHLISLDEKNRLIFFNAIKKNVLSLIIWHGLDIIPIVEPYIDEIIYSKHYMYNEIGIYVAEGEFKEKINSIYKISEISDLYIYLFRLEFLKNISKKIDQWSPEFISKINKLYNLIYQIIYNIGSCYGYSTSFNPTKKDNGKDLISHYYSEYYSIYRYKGLIVQKEQYNILSNDIANIYKIFHIYTQTKSKELNYWGLLCDKLSSEISFHIINYIFEIIQLTPNMINQLYRSDIVKWVSSLKIIQGTTYEKVIDKLQYEQKILEIIYSERNVLKSP